MNAPRSNASAWGEAGRAAGKTYATIANTTRKYSPKAGEMEKLGLEARSSEKIAGIKAETAVRKAKIGADALIKKTEINVDKFKSINESKKGVRKAGMVAAAGQAIGLGLMKDTELPPTSKAIDYSAMETFFANQTKRDDAAEAKLRAEMKPSATTPSATTPTTSKPVKGKGGLKLVNYLVNNKGYTPVSAAAIAGNAAHESANFTAHEEYAPNAYGTKGAGFLQWTNAGGSNRRTEFENYAGSQGIDPTSFEASAGYIDAEMKGGKHWTGGMNVDSFRQIKDLNTAVTSFQNNYLRPAAATANTGARLNYANQFLQQYNNQ